MKDKMDLRDFKVITAIVLVFLVIFNLFIAIQLTNVTKTVRELAEVYDAEHTELVDKPGELLTKATDIQEVQLKLSALYTRLTSENRQMTLQLGVASNDDSDTDENGVRTGFAVYNTNKEFIMQDTEGFTEMFMTGGNTLVFSDGVGYGADLSYIDQLGKVIEMLESGDAVVSEEDGSRYGVEGVTEYAIDVRGYDNIKKIYSVLGDDIATDIVDGMHEQYKNINFAETPLGAASADVANFRYNIIIKDGDIISFGNYVYFGTERADWLKCFFNWQVATIASMDDWEINPDFYSYDYTKLKDDNAKTIISMMDKQMSALAGMLTGETVDTTLNPDAKLNSENSNSSDETASSGSGGADSHDGHNHNDDASSDENTGSGSGSDEHKDDASSENG